VLTRLILARWRIRSSAEQCAAGASASRRSSSAFRSAADPAAAGQSRRKVIEHPAVGRMALDCDTLVVAGDNPPHHGLHGEPGTEDADRLELAIVLGTQSLVE
jgi:hypothetical protein